MASEYDVVVLGAGPGGYIAAIRASQLGLKTAIIEKEYWGGVCLNIGCIPSKALLKNAEIAHTLQHKADSFGFSFDNLQLDYSVAFDRSRKVSDKFVKGVGFLMKKNKIDQYDGWGNIIGDGTIKIDLTAGGEETVSYKNLIIATGAHVRSIPGVELDQDDTIVSYIPAILSDSNPKSAIVVGAGPIGLEFSYVWNNYGTDVTIVEMLDRVAPLEDPDVSKELARAYKKLGINMLTSSRVSSIERTSNGAKVTVDTPDGQQVLEAEKVLVAIGFAPNTEGYGLDKLGVELNKRDGIQIDPYMRTNVSNVYAIGDVTAELMLAHVASAMGVIAAETIAGVDTVPLEYKMMPRCTYSQPQIASFGYTEEEARELGYELEISQFPFQANGKAVGLDEGVGFVKLIVDAKYGEILGAHMVGPEVTELLPEYTLARSAELTAEEIGRNVHAHPTLSEALMEVAHGIEGHMMNL